MILLRQLLIFSFFLCLPLQASSQHLLTSMDVKKIMDQLLEHHIDHKQLNDEIVRRSLKTYITSFDHSKTYLLDGEVNFYVQPSDALVSSILLDYQRDRFGAYFGLNQLIGRSIERARNWRYQWEKDPVALVNQARLIKDKKFETSTDYACSADELKERYKTHFLKYISLMMDDLGYTSYDGLEAKLVKLCDKQLTEFENSYLGIKDSSKPFSDKELEHLIVQRILKSLAHSLDAHTAYFSPEEAYAMKVQLEKGMCGVGVVLREGIEGVIVHEMLKGGPASCCGQITIGDAIVEVDGKSVRSVPFRHVLEVMRGKEGTKMVLGIQKPGSSDYKKVTLVRTKISLEEQRVEYTTEPFADGVIGKITVGSFYEGEGGVSTEQDLRRAISQLKESGPLYGLVLDMRDNSGGFLSQAIKVAGLFVSNGVIVVSKYADGSVKYYRTVDGRRLYDGPLVILISKTSASATEIVAQALQDFGVALVVGDEKTYGKGTIQHQTVTDDASQSFFKVTIGKYYTVSGRSTQIQGVKSDIVVPTYLHFAKIGEDQLDYPLKADNLPAAYEDQLVDVDPFAKRWFQKNYIPNLQKKEVRWSEKLPVLQENSEYRISKNKNYQIFLKDIKDAEPVKSSGFGKNDLQMEESINIIKDMIFLAK
jgi:carboxyl-terminal processing protease